MTRRHASTGSATSARLGFGAVALALLCGFFYIGCDGVTPPNGGGGSSEEATIRGTVTNDATGEALVGAKVSIGDMAEATTDDAGEYSQTVPIGVYDLSFENDFFTTVQQTIAVGNGETATVDVALSPSQPVAIRTEVEGDPAPDGTVTLRAVTEVLDGATTVQGFNWSQGNSVEVIISGATTDTASVALPDVAAYKAELMKVLREPPVSGDQLPPNVPVPDAEEFPGGLPDRFQVVGINPFALEETGLVKVMLEVETSAGTYSEEVEIHAALPWKPASGIRNVPVGVPVLLSGKAQDAYDWALSAPAGSSASLVDATTQEPYYTPDVAGLYRVTVTDTTGDADEEVTLEIYAGTWVGSISGQDADGNPLSANCTVCHNGGIAGDQFTPWAQSGHATAFANGLDTNDHFSERCFVCHSIGYDTEVENGGFDDASDFAAFLDAGFLSNPGDNWSQVIEDFPNTAQKANIQCENCHGPQGDSGAHTMTASRVTLSSDNCATCHGEPLRHGRFQQWQLSGHANFELAIDEGESGSCSRCHTANGFLAWLPVLLDDDPATDPLDDVEVTWAPEDVQPLTCVVCHDPHDVGTVSGANTDATVRIYGDTPPLIGGFQVFGAGGGAICMTCHNSRRGLRNDDNFDEFLGTSEAARAPHGSSQADVLMGQNAFLVEVGVRGQHSFVEDTCVACHMTQTPPPDILSYNQGGTNHTFFAASDVCAACHTEIPNSESIEIAFNATSSQLKLLVEAALLELMGEQLDAGNSIDLGGDATVSDLAEIASLDFGEARGRQAITVTLAGGDVLGPYRLPDVLVLDAADAELGGLYDFADPRLIKAGWNWNLANNDGSKGSHNPSFVFEFLDASIDALNELAAE